MRSSHPSPFAIPVAMIALALLTCSCSVSASVGSFDRQKASYDNAWNAGWSNISRDERPFASSATSPGICNVGGTKQGCFDTDRVVISDYQALGRALTKAPVPAGFVGADATVHRAIDLEIKGLEERNAIIADPSQSGTFAQSNLDLRGSQLLFQQGFRAYTGSQAPAIPFKE